MKKILLLLLGIWLLYEFYIEKWIKGLNLSFKKLKIICIVIGIIFTICIPHSVLKDQMYKILSICKSLNSSKKITESKSILIPYSTSDEPEKRRVSGYMKKWIASEQQWKCKKCGNMLEASYEVDHILSLGQGGKNDESNLMALCRKCHGLKTFRERIKYPL